jgi:hypothetical protein
MTARTYPVEFLGRCGTCLDNAYLNSEPCTIGYGNGMPMFESECAVRCGRRQCDESTDGPVEVRENQGQTTTRAGKHNLG